MYLQGEQVPTLLKSKKKPPSCQVLQENRNSFDVILAKADTLKQLAGPVYLKGDSQHAFLELLQKVYSAKSLCGTIYLEGQAKHQYNELQKQADKIKRRRNPSTPLEKFTNRWRISKPCWPGLVYASLKDQSITSMKLLQQLNPSRVCNGPIYLREGEKLPKAP